MEKDGGGVLSPAALRGGGPTDPGRGEGLRPGSRRRLRGHRIELFLLDLSFLGWALLLLLPLVGILVGVWVLPYWTGSCLLFYDEISAGLDSKPPFDEDQYPL